MVKLKTEKGVSNPGYVESETAADGAITKVKSMKKVKPLKVTFNFNQ